MPRLYLFIYLLTNILGQNMHTILQVGKMQTGGVKWYTTTDTTQALLIAPLSRIVIIIIL